MVERGVPVVFRLNDEILMTVDDFYNFYLFKCLENNKLLTFICVFACVCACVRAQTKQSLMIEGHHQISPKRQCECVQEGWPDVAVLLLRQMRLVQRVLGSPEESSVVCLCAMGRPFI